MSDDTKDAAAVLAVLGAEAPDAIAVRSWVGVGIGLGLGFWAGAESGLGTTAEPEVPGDGDSLGRGGAVDIAVVGE